MEETSEIKGEATTNSPKQIEGNGATEKVASSESVATEVDSKTSKPQMSKDAAEEAPPHKRAKCDETVEEEEQRTSSSTEKEKVDTTVAAAIEPRKFQRIPVFIVDYHNDVLEFIYRCLATRHLPLENNVLVHFDSHPDMVISREIPASASYDKETMLAELSIENWIMPACYAGHFNRVIWLKNSWCRQIPIGKYNFKVGHKNDKISVDCPLDYFISEGNYSITSELEQARDMELQVLNVDTEEEVDPTKLLCAADAPNFILDIDLDFFSTSNPFLEIYKDANCYEQLTEIFHFDSADKDCAGTTERRKHQLEALKQIFEHLEEARSFDGLKRPTEEIISTEIFTKIENLVQSLQKYYTDDEIDWLLIYDSGSTTDTNGLPHHISTTKELQQYFANFKKFLQRLPAPPVIITMACSAEDDYVPKDQVTYIQEHALTVLREVFGERLHKEPICHYKDEEWDVMKL